jgi:hypothetical protein
MLERLPPYGEGDPDSPYPSVRWIGTLKTGERRQMDFAVPRVKGEGADSGRVELSVFVTESDTQAPLADARVFVEALRGELSIDAGSARTGADGRATILVLRGERYRVRVRRWSAAGVATHEGKQFEASPVGDRVSVEVALSRVTPR